MPSTECRTISFGFLWNHNSKEKKTRKRSSLRIIANKSMVNSYSASMKRRNRQKRFSNVAREKKIKKASTGMQPAPYKAPHGSWVRVRDARGLRTFHWNRAYVEHYEQFAPNAIWCTFSLRTLYIAWLVKCMKNSFNRICFLSGRVLLARQSARTLSRARTHAPTQFAMVFVLVLYEFNSSLNFLCLFHWSVCVYLYDALFVFSLLYVCSAAARIVQCQCVRIVLREQIASDCEWTPPYSWCARQYLCK